MPVCAVFRKWRVSGGAAARAALCAAALFIFLGCGGGFGSDSGNAPELGPGIFEPDTGQRR